MIAFASPLRFLGLLLAGLPQVIPAQSETRESIPSLVAAAAKELDIPGLSYAVVRGDEFLYSGGIGFADVENEVLASDATVYRLASISKPITAVLILQLVEGNKLDLDADVSTLVAEWPKKRWPVTSRQLLGHLGGVRHYRRLETESTTYYRNQRAGLVRFANDPLAHEPGTKHLYSTYGFNLLAAVVETQSNQSFADAVKQRIAVPTGAMTLQDDDQRRIIKGRAQGYVRRGGQLQNSKLMDSSYKLGGGGLCASAPDLARFAQALLAGRLLQPETLQAMWTEQHTSDGTPVGYGLGFGVKVLNGQRIVQHSGAQSRVSTMLYMLPDERIAVVLLCNLEGLRLGTLARALALEACTTDTIQTKGRKR